MIDASRWVIVEAWLSLGLRLRWAGSYTAREDGWQDDEETKQAFRYGGFGEWEVLDRDTWRTLPRPEVPQLSTATMRHELAHYLIATPAQREKRNFDLSDRFTDEYEERANAAEKVIDAMLVGANRIAAMALGAQARRS